MSAAPRRRAARGSFDYRPLLRRAGILLAVSFGLSLVLMTYLFGFSDGFFGRLLGSTTVLFTLLAVTFLLVVPFVNWAAEHWFGRTWAEAPTPQPARRPRAANVPKATNAPKPARYAPRHSEND
ncbi:hypothetical protein F0P96_07750 [Hymenobacter busanensis]|uniref:Uncharacterized protein n=1 Tax=Hymenobacter busanensis TaxID=2607656 RepID=A0A7L5A0Y5_9BACT|nr:hypothetical protein [Hymenobacter busanensis]KAA9338706.1 hypothetical protein F0P96_07750 [Hymenobacter busanensis]QHJ08863.1 hypothetical protein GUY19_16850 [Hymenobacter busanensis]